MNDTREILEGTGTIAVVGLSTNPAKTAHRIPLAMKQMGYRVIGVHPTADTLLGSPAYRRLADIDESIDLVNVFRPSDEATQVVRDAIAINARAVWLQSGIWSPEGRRLAEAAGIAYVEDRCIMIEARMHGLVRAG